MLTIDEFLNWTIRIGNRSIDFGGVNVGVGVNIPIGESGPRARAATLEIRFGEGVKPDDANAYDAHAIAANIRARLLAPR